jgi:hypothetical protein
MPVYFTHCKVFQNYIQCNHCFVMQPLPDPPLCSSTVSSHLDRSHGLVGLLEPPDHQDILEGQVHSEQVMGYIKHLPGQLKVYTKPVLRICIGFRADPDPDPEFWVNADQVKKMFLKIAICLSPSPQGRTFELQQKPPEFKREHPALKNMKCLSFFLFMLVISMTDVQHF